MWLTNNILREILYKNNNVCCMCLKATGEDAWRVNDEVNLNDPDISIELSQIISSVFENKISETEYVSHNICEECVKSAISAFKFIDKCRYINEKISTFINNITNCLEDADSDNLVKAKGMFVSIDPQTFQTKVYCNQKKSVHSVSILLKRLREGCIKSIEKNFSTSNTRSCGVVFSHSKVLKSHKRYNCKKSKSYKQDHEMNDENDDINYNNADIDSAQNTTQNIIKRKQRKLYLAKLGRVLCEHCGTTCRNKYNLKKHMQKNCKVIKAKLLSEDAKYNIGLLENLNKKTKREISVQSQFESVTCNYCDLSFQNKSVLKVHIHKLCKNAPAELKQKYKSICSYCGKIVTKYALKEHESRHTSRFECSKCGKVLKTEKGYQKHLQIPNCNEKPLEFTKPIKKFNCHVCDKQFAAKGNLKEHILAFHSDSGFECMLCKRKLSSKYSLKIHMVVHTKEKNFECETCGGKFVSKASLLYHIRTHTGEKPYKCKYCDRRFLSASRRNIHTRIHHLPPQLKCKYCMKLFKHWGALHKHRKRHFIPSSSLYLGNGNSQTNP